MSTKTISPKSLELAKKIGLVNTDLTAERREYVFKFPVSDSWIKEYMRDPRDLPMVYLMVNIAVTVLPAAFFLFVCNWEGWKYHALGVLYVFLADFMYMQRFILCLHYGAHRMVFKKYEWLLNNFNSHILGPFFGIPSGMYFLHHCVMHHTAGNVSPRDLSSTMPYQRDNFLHFIHYWLKFLTATWFYIPYYAVQNGNTQVAISGVLSLVTYGAVLSVFMKINLAATIYVFVVPFAVASGALMFGNWSQHIFVERKNPDTGYGCTINCVNHFENQLTFNDGYHIVHHLVSRLHWTEMPRHFMDNLQYYAETDALCFINLGFFEIGVMVMMQQWDKLADAVIQWGPIGGVVRNKEQTIAMLKERVKPFENFKGDGKRSVNVAKIIAEKKD